MRGRIVWGWISAYAALQVRRVGKGALAPCPPSFFIAISWWARREERVFAHPTIPAPSCACRFCCPILLPHPEYAPAASTARRCRLLSVSKVWGRVSRQTFASYLATNPRRSFLLARDCRVSGTSVLRWIRSPPQFSPTSPNAARRVVLIRCDRLNRVRATWPDSGSRCRRPAFPRAQVAGHAAPCPIARCGTPDRAGP